MLRDEESPIKADPVLWIIPLLLTGLGVLIITSTTSPMAFASEGTPFSVGFRQFRWFLVGLGALFLAMSVPIRFWLKTSGLWWVLALVMALATLVPGIGTSVGGARRWIRIAGVSVQSGEMLVLALTLHLTKLLYKNKLDTMQAFIKTIMVMAISMVPLLMQPDLGTTILVFCISMGLFVETYGWKLPIATGIAGVAAVIPLIAFEPYRMRRIMAFLDPWSDPLDKGFQAIQGLIAFSNGGVWGTGLGHGFQKLQYLPAAYTDFLYAALGEEMGLVGTLGVLMLFIAWSFRAKHIYNVTSDPVKRTLIWGITLTIIMPLFINIAGVTKLMPLTGMPLPFLSYGGSALVTMWFRVGIVIGIGREGMSPGEELVQI